MKYKPGDKVQIKIWKGKSKRPHHWNSFGQMDKWCGRIVTIRCNEDHRYRIVEDIDDRIDTNSGWLWEESDFLPVEYFDKELFEL